MSCGDFQQIRIGEFLTFNWSGNDLVKNPLDLSDAIDVGKFRGLTVSIVIFDFDKGGASDMKLLGSTAALNNDTYYADTNDTGFSLGSVDTSNGPVAMVATFEELSRFWQIGPQLVGDASGTNPKLQVTIDVVAR